MIFSIRIPVLTKLGATIQGRYKVKEGGLGISKVQFEESIHSLASTGEEQHRGSIYGDPKDSFPAKSGIIYGYLQTEIEDEDERRVIKILGVYMVMTTPKPVDVMD